MDSSADFALSYSGQRYKSWKITRTTLAQLAANGPLWIPQLLKSPSPDQVGRIPCSHFLGIIRNRQTLVWKSKVGKNVFHYFCCRPIRWVSHIVLHMKFIHVRNLTPCSVALLDGCVCSHRISLNSCFRISNTALIWRSALNILSLSISLPPSIHIHIHMKRNFHPPYCSSHNTACNLVCLNIFC